MSDGNSGFKNLRAMFETQSAASSPEPRGRSPAKFNTDSNAPTPSKIRASFVSVEPSAQAITRELGTTKGTPDGLNSPTAHRRESFSLSADPTDDTVAELKKEVTREKEDRENSATIIEAVPEEAVETRESSQVPPPIREVKSTMPNLGTIMKGSNFPEPEAAAEEKPTIVEDPTPVEPEKPVAVSEPAPEDIASQLAALSLANGPAKSVDKAVPEAQEATSTKAVESEDKIPSSGDENLPLPEEEGLTSTDTTLSAPTQVADPEPIEAASTAVPTLEATAVPEDIPAPIPVPEVKEPVEDTPAQDVVEDVPVTKAIEDVPASKATEEAPIPKSTEDASSTKTIEDVATTEATDDISTTQTVQDAPTSQAPESAPITETVVESTSTAEAPEAAPSTDVSEAVPVKETTENTPLDAAESAAAVTKPAGNATATKPVIGATAKGKPAGTSNTSSTNSKAVQKPPAISTTRTAATKASSSKSPLPRSPGLARLPKTPTTPKPTIPTSSAKSPAPAKGPSRVVGSKDSAAHTKSSAVPKDSSKSTATTKDHGKTSLPAARTARASLLPHSSAASTVAKGKAPVVDSKTSTARSSSIASASKEPKAANAASVSKDAKEPAKGHTTSPGGFKKPRPKSPTKPVGLPSRLTAQTAASSAKHDEETSQKVTRKPSTASRPPQPKTASATVAKKPAARASLAPSTAPSKRPESRASTTGASGEGFLARMMRPTTSSASKTHEKPASPPRRGASVRVAPKAKAGHESAIAKGKKKVVDVAHKAKEAVTNGHTDEHTEGSGTASADETTVAHPESADVEPQSEQTITTSGQPAEKVATPEAREITT